MADSDRALFDPQCFVEFLNGFLEMCGDVFAIARFHLIADFTQHPAGFGDQCIGLQLAFVRRTASFKIQAEVTPGCLQFLERRGPMSLVVALGELQQDVGVREFLTRRLSICADAERQDQRTYKNLQTE
jgi:hypothetical protein